jgi:hypothetical protein
MLELPSAIIEFLDSHRPPLEDGSYRISIQQQITGTDIIEPLSTKDALFTIAGPQVSISPQDIAAVFPPQGNLGDYSNVFPHILFNRTTLPWERTAEVDATPDAIEKKGAWESSPAPWLALLLFTEKEMKTDVKIPDLAAVTLGSLRPLAKTGDPEFPPIIGPKDTVPSGPHLLIAPPLSEKTLISVIDIRGSWLNSHMPTGLETRILANVRIGRSILFDFDGDVDIDKPQAVLDAFQQHKVTLKDGLKIEPLADADTFRLTDESGSFLLRKVAGKVQVAAWDGEEYGCIVGNRLPQRGEVSTVHLVSIEGRYQNKAFSIAPEKKDSFFRFISLYSWRFSCESHDYTFAGLLYSLNQLFVTDAGRAPANAPASATAAPVPDNLRAAFDGAGISLSDKATIAPDLVPTDSDFQGSRWKLLDQSYTGDVWQYSLRLNDDQLSVYCDEPSTLRLPRNSKVETEVQLAGGFTLLPHQFRDGSQSYSWYRGPLAPGPTEAKLALPAESSDALLVYDQNSGLFYTGYAAAWELGRMLCLANGRVSQALYQWKREHRRLLRQSDLAMQKKLACLPVKQPVSNATSTQVAAPGPEDAALLPFPEVVRAWFVSLRKLEPVPFRYFVPDERMLPVESIRFFQLDHDWMDSLADGAFSIGRVLEGDHGHDCLLHEIYGDDLHSAPTENVSGFMLRSAAVSGWPLLTVDASATSTDGQKIPLDILRLDRLAPDVLLCLFQGSAAQILIHLPQESIHFGLEEIPKAPGSNATNPVFDLPEANRAYLKGAGVSIQGDILRFQPPAPPPQPLLNPALFAFKMVEGVPEVIFGAI